MTTKATLGLGAALQRGNGDGPPETFTTITEVQDIKGPSPQLEIVDVTNHDSPNFYQEIIPGILKPGQVTFGCNWVPTASATQEGLRTDQSGRVLRNFKVVFTTTPAKTAAFAAYVTKFDPEAPVTKENKVSITLEISGPITWT